VDALGSVTFLAGPEEGFDLWQQRQIPGLTIRLPLISGRLTGQKPVKPAPGYLKKPT
jgi:hypothetical protein